MELPIQPRARSTTSSLALWTLPPGWNWRCNVLHEWDEEVPTATAGVIYHKLGYSEQEILARGAALQVLLAFEGGPTFGDSKGTLKKDRPNKETIVHGGTAVPTHNVVSVAGDERNLSTIPGPLQARLLGPGRMRVGPSALGKWWPNPQAGPKADTCAAFAGTFGRQADNRFVQIIGH